MSSCNIDCCSFTRGEVYLRELTGCGCGPSSFAEYMGCDVPASDLGIFLGNVIDLNLFIESETRGQSVYDGIVESPTCSTVVVTGVKVDLLLSCANPENMALSTYGKQLNVNRTGTVTNEKINPNCDTLTYRSCSLYKFAHPNIDTTSLVCTIL